MTDTADSPHPQPSPGAPGDASEEIAPAAEASTLPTEVGPIELDAGDGASESEAELEADQDDDQGGDEQPESDDESPTGFATHAELVPCKAGERDEVYVASFQGPGAMHPKPPPLATDPFAKGPWSLVAAQLVDGTRTVRLVWRRLVDALQVERLNLVRLLPIVVPSDILHAIDQGQLQVVPEVMAANPARPIVPPAVSPAVAPPRPDASYAGRPTVAASAPGVAQPVAVPPPPPAHSAPPAAAAPDGGGLLASVSVRAHAGTPPPVDERERQLAQAALPRAGGAGDDGRIDPSLQFSVRPPSAAGVSVAGGSGAAVVRPSSVAAPPLPPLPDGTPRPPVPPANVPQSWQPDHPPATANAPVSPPAPVPSSPPVPATSPPPPLPQAPAPASMPWLTGRPAVALCVCKQTAQSVGQFCAACGHPVMAPEIRDRILAGETA